MTERLAEKSCSACRGDQPALTGKELADYAAGTPEWNVVNEHHITRSFEFDDFAGAWRFVDKVARLAEQEDHHPTITFTYGKVEIELCTHKIDGLTENDFILAAKIDTLEH